jgi:predicted ester cyclase
MDRTAASKALLRRITEEIWNGRRYDLIDELVSDEFVDHVDLPGIEGTGRARYAASVRAVHAGFSDYHEHIEQIVAEDDRAVSYVRITGTHDGDLFGLPPTRRRVDYLSMGLLRFRDGLVVERWGLGDGLTQMQQLGLLG